jgi:hypothetical protein
MSPCSRFSKPTFVVLIVLAICSVLPSMATTCTVTSTDDTDTTNPSGTLRWAIGQANGGTCDTINFSLTYPATITHAQGQLEISNTSVPVTISGPGVANMAISV